MKEIELAKDAYTEHKNYSTEKAKAEKAHREQITALREEIATLNTDFKEKWAARKLEVKANLDNAALAALEAGASPNALLLAIGSRNPTWIYQLKNGGLESSATPDTPREHPLLVGVSWDFHEHTGSHGVLRSADSSLFKLYVLPEGEIWFIVDSELQLVTGSSTAFEATPKAELERRTELLSNLLDGNYVGKTRMAANPYVT